MRSSQASSIWYKLHNSVERHMKMQCTLAEFLRDWKHNPHQWSRQRCHTASPFPFSLEGKARKWFYTHQDNINNWTNLSDAFLSKFFPIGKTTALRENIVSFQQQKTETISQAWERFQGYISDCPHHGMATWLLMQTFYHGLT